MILADRRHEYERHSHYRRIADPCPILWAVADGSPFEDEYLWECERIGKSPRAVLEQRWSLPWILRHVPADLAIDVGVNALEHIIAAIGDSRFAQYAPRDPEHFKAWVRAVSYRGVGRPERVASWVASAASRSVGECMMLETTMLHPAIESVHLDPSDTIDRVRDRIVAFVEVQGPGYDFDISAIGDPRQRQTVHRRWSYPEALRSMTTFMRDGLAEYSARLDSAIRAVEGRTVRGWGFHMTRSAQDVKYLGLSMMNCMKDRYEAYDRYRVPVFWMSHCGSHFAVQLGFDGSIVYFEGRGRTPPTAEAAETLRIFLEQSPSLEATLKSYRELYVDRPESLVEARNAASMQLGGLSSLLGEYADRAIQEYMRATHEMLRNSMTIDLSALEGRTVEYLSSPHQASPSADITISRYPTRREAVWIGEDSGSVSMVDSPAATEIATYVDRDILIDMSSSVRLHETREEPQPSRVPHQHRNRPTQEHPRSYRPGRR